MISRKISLAIVTIAALVPALSNASPDRASVKACASAFATSMSAPGSTVRPYKLDYHSNFGTSVGDFYNSEYTFTLEARDPKTGLTTARANCSADTRGNVINFTAVPLGTTLVAQ